MGIHVKIGTGQSGKLLVWVVGLAALSLVAFAACGSDSKSDKTPTKAAGTTPAVTSAATSATTKTAGDYSKLSGNIVVDGSSTVGPVTEAMAEEFGKVSKVKVSVGISGTGGGFEKFCKGETDISDASRAIKKTDAKEGVACDAAGIAYEEFKIGIDGLTVVVNPQNTWAKCMTFSQLKKLWNQGSAVKKWNEIDPSWPADDIKLFGPGPDSGTFDYFTETINGKVDQSRSDYTASEDDNVLVQGVENDKNALGYFGYAYYKEAGKKLTAVQVNKDADAAGTPVAADKAKGCVAPGDTTVLDNSYPLSRPLFIYPSKKALARPEVKGFVQFYLTNPQLIGDVGYVELPAADYAKALRTLSAY